MTRGATRTLSLPRALPAALLLCVPCLALHSRPAQQAETSRVIVHAGQPGCDVELDDTIVARTGAQGDATLSSVEPGDHYIHLRCPNAPDRGFFVSPHPGASVQLDARAAGAPPAVSPLEAAQSKTELRKLVQKAVDLRARGHFDDAVTALHEAAKMDPTNSDLHRELGITFLLTKEWTRARVELIEALKHDPADADAHNGLGYALEKMGNLKAAVEEYRMATRLDPDDQTYREHYFQALAALSTVAPAKTP